MCGSRSGAVGYDGSEAQRGDALHDRSRVGPLADRRQRAEKCLADRRDHGGGRQLCIRRKQPTCGNTRGDGRLGEGVSAMF
ncbi:hypothetical protein OG609_38430 [Streptomyces sp. NBC_01224]|uniref:hypothetical protein n=1 Tax=unclassified Streptomyces TaxID=2593676 RepID=UPI002E15EBA5|nr:hypothetical protein OG609_38430 [Streptomyces sp. NBC_01224]